MGSTLYQNTTRNNVLSKYLHEELWQKSFIILITYINNYRSIVVNNYTQVYMWFLGNIFFKV
jgi:hypothetical protein